jgi:hypothetical protein
MPLHPKAKEFAKSGLFAGVKSFAEKARWERGFACLSFVDAIRGADREVRSIFRRRWLIRDP